MNQNIELLILWLKQNEPANFAKLRLEIAELREKEAVRNTTAARAALLLALDGITDVISTPPPVWPDAGTNPPGWKSIDV